MEAFDRRGILVWNEAPIYQLPNRYLNMTSVRNAAISAVERMVRRDRSHPSVLAWSLGNELAFQESERGAVGPGFARFVRDGARTARKLDRTRLVALDRHSRIGEATYNRAFRVLDALGINEYFGWYRTAPITRGRRRRASSGRSSTAFTRRTRGWPCSSRSSAPSRRSTAPRRSAGYAFQSKYLREHLDIHGSKPFVNGSMIWILRDFRVGPGWTGGNDPRRATPPWNNKGLIDENGIRKPAFGRCARCSGARGSSDDRAPGRRAARSDLRAGCPQGVVTTLPVA